MALMNGEGLTSSIKDETNLSSLYPNEEPSFFQNFGIECKLSVYTKAPGGTVAVNTVIQNPWQKRNFYEKR